MLTEAILQNSRLRWCSGLITFILLLILAVVDRLISLDPLSGVVAHQFSFSKVQALQILQSWTEQGRELYFNTVILDFVFPLFYAFFLSSLIYSGVTTTTNVRSSWKISVMVILPFLACFFDWVENCYQIVQVLRMSSLPDWLFVMTSVVAMIKWLLLLITFCIVIYQKQWTQRG